MLVILCTIVIKNTKPCVCRAVLSGRRTPQWGYPFFGLTDEYKVSLHELIFDLAHHGNIEYFAVYEMPVQYRTFYIRKLMNMKEKERVHMDKAMGKEDAPSSKVVKGPQINRG